MRRLANSFITNYKWPWNLVERLWQNREEYLRNPPLQAAAAANNFLDLPHHHRSARLLKLLTPDEFSTVVLYSISRHVSTSSFLLSRSKLTRGSVSGSKLRRELGVLAAMVAESLPDSLLYCLKQQSVSTLYSKPQDEIISPNFHFKEKLLTPTKCRKWVHLIDNLNMPKINKKMLSWSTLLFHIRMESFLRAHSCQSFLRRISIISSSLLLNWLVILTLATLKISKHSLKSAW